jgi:hypothetical protein
MTIKQKLDDDVEIAIRRMIKQRVSVDEVRPFTKLVNFVSSLPDDINRCTRNKASGWVLLPSATRLRLTLTEPGSRPRWAMTIMTTNDGFSDNVCMQLFTQYEEAFMASNLSDDKESLRKVLHAAIVTVARPHPLCSRP